MNNVLFYLIYLWHKNITSEAFLITFTHENNIGENLVTVHGDKIQILWEKERYYEGYRKCYKYWARYAS